MKKVYIVLKKQGKEIFCNNPFGASKVHRNDEKQIDDMGQAKKILKWYQAGWPENHYEIVKL